MRNKRPESAWRELKGWADSSQELSQGRIPRSSNPDDKAAIDHFEGQRRAYESMVEMMDAFEHDGIAFEPPPEGEAGAKSDKRLREIAAWVADTCLLYGAPPELAYRVSSIFVAGLRREWERRHQV